MFTVSQHLGGRALLLLLLSFIIALVRAAP